jgi:hypothetical protein
MKKTEKKHIPQADADAAKDIEFCLNCNDMDDLATSDEVEDVEQLRRRFNSCVENGRFEGDFCARLYVAEDRIDDADVFADEDEDA